MTTAPKFLLGMVLFGVGMTVVLGADVEIGPIVSTFDNKTKLVTTKAEIKITGDKNTEYQPAYWIVDAQGKIISQIENSQKLKTDANTGVTPTQTIQITSLGVVGDKLTLTVRPYEPPFINDPKVDVPKGPPKTKDVIVK
jgi:hypothetical protein